jgi:energy-converting hydrogenase B subunit Q
MTIAEHAVIITAVNQPGVLSKVTRVLAKHGANISHVDIIPSVAEVAQIYFEFTLDRQTDQLLADLKRLPDIKDVEGTLSFSRIYGKRIVIIGGGAQVGQVAVGAITEADRHNIRGERISVDTIPLIGEKEIASAVRALVRLPRVRLLVLAGSLMGGEITKVVQDVRRKGLVVISLSMAGGVPDAADMVVTDPIQAGVMAVMAVADTARFDIIRQQKKRY